MTRAKPKPPEPKWLQEPHHAVIYVRISPRPQEGETSIEKQIGDCITLCKLHKLKIVKTYIDDKKSGRSREGRQIDAAIDYCETNKCALVSYDISRISRGWRDMLNLLDEMETRGVWIKTVSGPQIDTTSAHGRLIVRMMISINAYMRENTSQATKDALAFRRKNRMAHGIDLPWGWRRLSYDPDNADYKRIEPWEWEQRIEVWIAWRAQLGFRPLQLRNELIAREYMGRGKAISVKTTFKLHEIGKTTDIRGAKPFLDVSDLYIHRLWLAGQLDQLKLRDRWDLLTHRRIVIRRSDVDKFFDQEGYVRVSIRDLFMDWNRRAEKQVRVAESASQAPRTLPAPPNTVEKLCSLMLLREGQPEPAAIPTEWFPPEEPIAAPAQSHAPPSEREPEGIGY